MNNPKGEKKLKRAKNNNAKNIMHEINDCCMIDDDEGLMMNKNMSLTICLKPQDDFPHPRHLCFTYPFGKSSPKKHCIKCYCYVCEKVAPCKYWKKTPKRHCDATEQEAKWVLQRKLNKKLPGGITTMLYHKLTVFACYDIPERGDVLLHGCGGGLISNSGGEWDIGIAIRLGSAINTHGNLAEPYIALVEGLQIAWLRGFRFLEIKLCFLFHNRFWFDFTRDPVTYKFRLCVKLNRCNPRAWVILKQVEDCLNRQWFIDVKNTVSCEEESGASFVAQLAEYQDQAKEVYDFKVHPLDTEAITREITTVIRETASFVIDVLGRDASAEKRKFYGLN